MTPGEDGPKHSAHVGAEGRILLLGLSLTRQHVAPRPILETANAAAAPRQQQPRLSPRWRWGRSAQTCSMHSNQVPPLARQRRHPLSLLPPPSSPSGLFFLSMLPLQSLQTKVHSTRALRLIPTDCTWSLTLCELALGPVEVFACVACAQKGSSSHDSAQTGTRVRLTSASATVKTGLTLASSCC